MALDEFSVGPLYIALDESPKRLFRPGIGKIWELCEPYRTGKALVLPTGSRKALAIGFWTRDLYVDMDEHQVFVNDWPDWCQYWDSEDDEVVGRILGMDARFRPRARTAEEKALLDEVAEEEEARGADES